MATIYLSGATKKGKDILDRARTRLGTDLFDVYGNVSKAKYTAWKSCKDRCETEDGENFRICGRNAHQFTVAWEYVNPETGEIMTHYETKDNIYIVDGSR